MTERSENVEPPFARRNVQLTVAVIVTAAVLWVAAVTCWPSALPHQHNHLLDLSESFGASGTDETGLIQIDLNTAEARELALLPGVGPVLAKRIAENRERLGPFSSVDDVGRVYGIGPKKLIEIKQIGVVEFTSPPQQSDPRLAAVGDPDESDP